MAKAAMTYTGLPTDHLEVRHQQRVTFGRRSLADAGLSNLHSDVDEIVFGRDADGSGKAVKDVRQSRAFSGANGQTSRHASQATDRQRKHFGGVSNLSDVDRVVFGRDLDGSGGARKLADYPEFDGAGRCRLVSSGWRWGGAVARRHGNFYASWPARGAAQSPN